MILLLHLSGCSQLDEESILSRDLVDRVFKLRVDRKVNGAQVRELPLIRGVRKVKRSNPRYNILWTLRVRLWHKFGWSITGIEDLQKALQVDTTVEDTRIAKGNSDIPALETTNQGNDEGPENTIVTALDDIFPCDPMDMLQWDEWESLTSGFFTL
jgi:hypothetical protein